jgi:hypothetical protein
MANNDWSRERLAWVAGLFEGEGCISQFDSRWSVHLASTDHDVLVRLNDIVGLGQINGPYDRGHKPHWVWQCASQPKVYAFLVAIYPWLGERRGARALEAIRGIVAHRPGQHRSSMCKAGKHQRTPENVRTTVENGRTRRRCIPCSTRQVVAS